MCDQRAQDRWHWNCYPVVHVFPNRWQQITSPNLKKDKNARIAERIRRQQKKPGFQLRKLKILQIGDTAHSNNNNNIHIHIHIHINITININ